MKKITLTLVFLLAVIMGSYGQATYNYGWEPTGSGSWLSVGPSGSFVRTSVNPCVGTASIRANIFDGKSSTLTSPSLGTSNGGTVALSFDYKMTNFSANTTGADPTQFSIAVEFSNSTTGPWVNVGDIGEGNHQASASCTTMNYSFDAFPGNLYIRFKTRS